MLESVENAITEMPRVRATCATDGTESANSGPSDDLGAFVDRLLRDLLRALRAAGVVLDQELDVGILEFRERHLGGVLHRLRGDAGIARCRQRQDQADLDLAVADRGRLLRRSRRRRAAFPVPRTGWRTG